MSNGARNWVEKLLKKGSSRDISYSSEHNKMTMKPFTKKMRKLKDMKLTVGKIMGVPISIS